MFNTDLAAAIATDIGASAGAITAVEAGQEAAVANFLNSAVSHLGFGIGAVVAGATGTTLAVTTGTTAAITGYEATFTVNGKAANIVFSATPAVFPVGATQYQGATQTDGPDADTVVGDSRTDPYTSNATTPTATLWKAIVTIDGDDAGSTLEAAEQVMTLTKLVK